MESKFCSICDIGKIGKKFIKKRNVKIVTPKED